MQSTVMSLLEAAKTWASKTPAALLVLYAVILPIVLVVLRKVLNDLFDPNRRIPGPFLARYTRLWLLSKIRTGDFPAITHELHKKYGPVVREAPGVFSVNTEDAVRVIYAHGSKFPKADMYKPWGNPQFRNLFNSTDPHHHNALRRKLAGVYSLSALKSYEPCVDECIALYKERLGEIAAQGRTVDLHRWNQCFAFDLITLITWSSRLGFLDRGEDEMGLMDALEADQWYMTQIGLWDWIHPHIQPYLIKLGLPGGRGPRAGHLFARNAFERKKASQGEVEAEAGRPEDFVQKLLTTRERGEKSNSNLSDTDILVAAGQNMGAGSDTTGITLSSIVYHLCKHPRALQKLRREIDEGRESGRVSEPITYDEASRMPFLQAVIKEGLRIHPALSQGFPRVVPEGGASIAGHFFPPGSIVEVNPYVYHRNEHVYGPDAGEFKPERWLEGYGAGKISDIDFMTFGQGARTCIGKNISLLEINKLVPQLVSNFDFELSTPNAEWSVRTFSFAKPTDFFCKVIRRGI